MRRHKMGNAQSKRVFRKGAQNVHPKNVSGAPMRGGIRL